MARSPQWGFIAILHYPFCLYICVIASQVTVYDEFNDPAIGGLPSYVSPDDADKAGNVSVYISVIAGLLGTITDLFDLLCFLISRRNKLAKIFATTKKKDRSGSTPIPQVMSPKPSSPKCGYVVVVLRFIMVSCWVSALVWGLTPTDVLMYIDIDPGDDIADEDHPNFSDAVIGFIGWLLFLDIISCMSPFIERCFLYFNPQGLPSVGNAGKGPADGHREIGSIGLGQLKSAGSIPIGHTLSVEDV